MHEARLPLNELQLHIGIVHTHLASAPLRPPSVPRGTPAVTAALPDRGNEQAHVGEWHAVNRRQHEARQARSRALREAERALAAASYRVTVLPMETARFWMRWNITRPSPHSLPWSTITAISVPDTAAPLCLDFGAPSAGIADPIAPVPGTIVGVSPCGPADGSVSYDRTQRWVLHPDATLRPFSGPQLCLTNFVHTTSSTPVTAVSLELCDARVEQHWAYHGGAPGQEGQEEDGFLEFGDCANALGVVTAA
jgi:hypothetical protein